MEYLALALSLACGLMIVYFIRTRKTIKNYNKLLNWYSERHIGKMVIDRSDPEAEPYVFLEIDRSGVEEISKQTYVVMQVENKNYVSR